MSDLDIAAIDLLAPTEKWFFDHHGYILLKDVVPKADIYRMIALGDRWHELPLEQLPPPLTSTALKDPNASPTLARWVNHVQYLDGAFQRLVLNRKIMRVILALTRGNPCLVDTALTKNYRSSDEITFHAAGRDYHVDNMVPYAGFLNAAISLVDVPEGAGFVCLPGSHKRNFELPETISIYDGPPTVANISVNAGDCLIFTEALYHGALPWSEDIPRMTVFNRYIGSGSHSSLPLEDYKHLISSDIYELEQPAVVGQRKQVVDRLLDDLASDAR